METPSREALLTAIKALIDGDYVDQADVDQKVGFIRANVPSSNVVNIIFHDIDTTITADSMLDKMMADQPIQMTEHLL